MATARAKPETPVVIRRLWRPEAALFREHFDRLDAHSRSMRFGGAVHASFIDTYVESALSGNGMVYGAFVDGELRGVGEIRFISETYPWRAEAAFSVEPDWQHKGLGDALFDRIIAVARNRSIAGIDMWCRTSNLTMRRLADRHGADLVFEGDEVHGHLTMPFATPASMIEEFMGEAIGIGGMVAGFSQLRLPGSNRRTNLASPA